MNVQVSQADIVDGSSNHISPLLIAIKRAYPLASRVELLDTTVRIFYVEIGQEFRLPVSAEEFRIRQEKGLYLNLPFAFTLDDEVNLYYLNGARWKKTSQKKQIAIRPMIERFSKGEDYGK
jgi:hypothetical protein